jgi:hypothetical protein
MQGEEGEDNPKSPGTAALLEVPLRLAGLAMLLDCSGFTPLLTPNCSAAAAFFCSPTPPLYVQENLSDDEEEYAEEEEPEDEDLDDDDDEDAPKKRKRADSDEDYEDEDDDDDDE